MVAFFPNEDFLCHYALNVKVENRHIYYIIKLFSPNYIDQLNNIILLWWTYIPRTKFS